MSYSRVAGLILAVGPLAAGGCARSTKGVVADTQSERAPVAQPVGQAEETVVDPPEYSEPAPAAQPVGQTGETVVDPPEYSEPAPAAQPVGQTGGAMADPQRWVATWGMLIGTITLRPDGTGRVFNVPSDGSEYTAVTWRPEGDEVAIRFEVGGHETTGKRSADGGHILWVTYDPPVTLHAGPAEPDGNGARDGGLPVIDRG